MKVKWKCGLIAGLALMTASHAARAQLFYVGVRGGAAIPTGTFSETNSGSVEQFLQGAAPGLGYGADAGIGAGFLGLYASIDRIQFECVNDPCGASGRYKLSGASGGVRLGVPLFPLIKPWVKGGIVVHDLAGTPGDASGTRIETIRRPGYEVGGGIDIPVAGIFSLTPQVRYIRQRLKYRLEPAGTTATNARDVNYYTFDIAFRLRSPI